MVKTREEWAKLINILIESEKLDDDVIGATREIISTIMFLQAEVERWREQWQTLRAQLDHDREYGQGHKVARALFLMDEANEKGRTA